MKWNLPSDKILSQKISKSGDSEEERQYNAISKLCKVCGKDREDLTRALDLLDKIRTESVRKYELTKMSSYNNQALEITQFLKPFKPTTNTNG